MPLVVHVAGSCATLVDLFAGLKQHQLVKNWQHQLCRALAPPNPTRTYTLTASAMTERIEGFKRNALRPLLAANFSRDRDVFDPSPPSIETVAWELRRLMHDDPIVKGRVLELQAESEYLLRNMDPEEFEPSDGPIYFGLHSHFPPDGSMGGASHCYRQTEVESLMDRVKHLETSAARDAAEYRVLRDAAARDRAELRPLREANRIRRRQLRDLDEYMMWAESTPEDQLGQIRKTVECFRRGYSWEQIERTSNVRAEWMGYLSNVTPLIEPDLESDLEL